jgi:two-component system phosphate regulon sensor histidine kinase PhoR
MRFGIRIKLILSHLALALVIAGVFYLYLNHTMEKSLVVGITENLINEARLAQVIAGAEIVDMRRDAQRTASVIGGKIKARVTVIAPGGEVVGDSGADAPGMQNHSDRPEFIDALKRGTGTSIRYSETVHVRMLYVAAPFAAAGGQRGVVRLAIPLSQVETAMKGIHAITGAAIALALLCSVFLSYFLSNVTTRPLRAIAAAAASIGKGDLGFRIPVTGSDEASKLADVLNDMAARIEMQLDRLSSDRNRLDAILRSMAEGVMVIDAEGIVTLANPSFRELFAIEDQYVEGESLIEVTRQPQLIDALKKVLATGEKITGEITLSAPSKRTLLTRWVPLSGSGPTTGVVAVFHDITDLKRLEEIRSDFVANVSHELRTPVTVIKGYAETLVSEGEALGPEKISHFSSIILHHSDRLANLISDLLTLSQLESGKIEMDKAPVNLRDLVERVRVFFGERARIAGVAVNVSIPADIPPVAGDIVRLEQVLINLLENAIKYTPAGGWITVSAADEGATVKLSVADTGIGIPAKDIPRIFERFYRVDAARSRDIGGTGLGLSIVKHIVQAHGGAVRVESVPGRGSTFLVVLKKHSRC